MKNATEIAVKNLIANWLDTRMLEIAKEKQKAANGQMVTLDWSKIGNAALIDYLTVCGVLPPCVQGVDIEHKQHTCPKNYNK